MAQLKILLISIACTIILFFVALVGGRRKFSFAIRAVAVCYFLMHIANLFFSDGFLYVINSGYFDGRYFNTQDLTQTFLRWSLAVTPLAFVMASFFDSRLFKNISFFFGLPVIILCTLNYDTFMMYYLSGTRGIVLAEGVRSVYFSTQLVLGLTISLGFAVGDVKMFSYESTNDFLRSLATFSITLPFAYLSAMPLYSLQSILGFQKMEIRTGTDGQIAWLALSFLLIVILYILFRFKNKRARYMLCVYLALLLSIQYNTMFITGLTLHRLPLQLCNLGAYIYVFTLVFKPKPLINTILLSSTLGAILASVYLTESSYTYFWTLHYCYEHTLDFIVPILAVLLRIFPRPEKVAIKHNFLCFSIYFFGVFLLGTILNGYAKDLGQDQVNYFFLFSRETATTAVPFIAPLFNVKLEFGRFYLYPVYQFLVYPLFVVACTLFWGLWKSVLGFLDDRMQLRVARIALLEKKFGKIKNMKKYYDTEDEILVRG
ncbi:MAG: YwaF family protein [Christensenellaceae bacterium]|jgi:hypothetical protein|nr:YwaF family protein [Christensenellaceae bacterium]